MPSAMTEVERRSEELPRRGVRVFVAVFLSAFVACGAPGPRVVATDRVAVVQQAPAPTTRSRGGPPSWPGKKRRRSRSRALAPTEELSPRDADVRQASSSERTAACRAWLDAALLERPQATEVRIYRVDWYLSHRNGARDEPPHLDAPSGLRPGGGPRCDALSVSSSAASAELAGVRIGLCAVLAGRLATGPYAELADRPRESLPAHLLHGALPSMPPRPAVVALQTARVLAAVLAAVGLRRG